ncbi:MAG TPA: hypothetical protein VF601_21500 [Beijerinckiaceae bacterium]|jgi:hypothetical protein
MHPLKLTRRHALMLGLAALFMAAGFFSAIVMKAPPPAGEALDRDALARLAAEAAMEPAATGSVD